MTLFGRISDILQANLNDLVDRFENPGKMLRQAIREIDDAIDAATIAAARSIASEKLLEKQIDSARAQAARCQPAAEAAVAAGDDERARRALSRRRQEEQRIELIEEQRASAHEVSVRWRRRIEAMKHKRADAGRMLIELAAAESVAQLRPGHDAGVFRRVASPAFDRFGRLHARVERALAEAEAVFEIASDGDWLADRNELEDEAIEVELLELKQRRVSQSG
ncbi:MAG TPA: PspA/IM30 family protein [Pirellulales bacterium]|nr:PspA/IM30 family protein [Pirellulales bacterium]